MSRIAALALIAAAACACQGDASAGGAERAKALEVFGEVPEFALTDQTGERFARSELAGKAVIANFIFTRCPTVCPLFTMKMQRVAERTAAADGLALVSFSVDPEYDTPEVLAAYAAEREIDPARWKFLTGDPATVKATVEGGLKMALDRQGTFPDGTPDIVHGTHFVLIDQRGRIRGYYDSTETERIDALVADAKALAKYGP